MSPRRRAGRARGMPSRGRPSAAARSPELPPGQVNEDVLERSLDPPQAHELSAAALARLDRLRRHSLAGPVEAHGPASLAVDARLDSFCDTREGKRGIGAVGIDRQL